ncbi:hypothetical protein NSB25_28370 [Acetatifactor muris]|uniref:Uncharacterized protein n=1 Tax=Acetatifactor muris TaxID=879566 RepID=A0A2K4ZQK3_9FIRM|nr:hypothetical protein [Acetatifactor muris]MCR2051135.1 hypothetical protein [Acetatifactor muris]SOY32774.1 hypothetical protein AMURIS_05541 [Acetatifactor muris]
MSIVKTIKQIPNDIVTVDENFQKLSSALKEYHQLVKEGKLIPRQNNIQNIYTVYSINSNVSM